MQNTPQLENGFIRIANELYDEIIRFPFSKREVLIVLAIIRKTYGYGKKKDDISLSQISKMTMLNMAHISRSVNDLVKMGVLLKQQGRYAQTLEVVKDYNLWKALPKQQRDYQKSNRPIAETASLLLPNQQIQKTTPKDNLQKTSKVRARFEKPTIPEIRAYCESIGAKNVNPVTMFNHYESNGWKVGKNPMVSWKATVRNWNSRDAK